MQNSFISIVVVLNQPQELAQLPACLQALYGVLPNHFSDYEIIVVNNTWERQFSPLLNELPAELRQQVFLLTLSSPVNPNHATMAGLDRANGDYTVLFEFQFMQRPEVVLELHQKSQEGYDVVYCQARQRNTNIRYRLLYKVFYSILKRYSSLKIDEKAHNTRIISRRALNSLLRLRENLRYMKAIFSMVGYPTAALSVAEPLERGQRKVGFSEQFRTSLVAITSFTTFLRTVLMWIFIGSFLFLLGVIYNAVKVKLTGIDLFGNAHETLSGWTFLVVLISIFFAITCLNLYIMSIYLSNIYNEIKQRPLYIVESYRRF